MPQWMVMDESTSEEFAKTQPPELWRRRRGEAFAKSDS